MTMVRYGSSLPAMAAMQNISTGRSMPISIITGRVRIAGCRSVAKQISLKMKMKEAGNFLLTWRYIFLHAHQGSQIYFSINGLYPGYSSIHGEGLAYMAAHDVRVGAVTRAGAFYQAR